MSRVGSRLRRVVRGFFRASRAQTPVDLAARVLDEIQIKPLVSRRRLAFAGAAFSTAAAVLVAVFLTRGGHQAQELAQGPAPAVNAPELPVQWTKLDDIPVVGPLLLTMNDLDQNADRYEELAKETGQGLASVVLRMPGVAGPRGVRPPGPPTLDGTGLWPLQVSEGLRPVRESVNETLNLLLKALPITFTAQSQPHAS